MAILSNDLHKAINTVWDASTLNATFRLLWNTTTHPAASYPVLHDSEASPNQPFPYCIFDQMSVDISSRMSGEGAAGRQEIHNLMFQFRIHAKSVSGDDRDAKQIAYDMAEEVVKVFGGHPTTAPTAITMDTNKHVITQLLSDVGERTGDEEYRVDLDYLFRIDVPMAA